MDRLVVVPKSEGKTTTPENPASSAKSAAINALKFALQHLCRAPFPGIGLAAGAILDVINRTQNMATVGNGWRNLTTRMANLGYLVSKVDKVDGSAALVERLTRELQELDSDLKSASKQNKLEAFFNGDDELFSIDRHNESLSNVVADFTFALANSTHQSVDKIRQDIEVAVKQIKAGENNPSGIQGMRLEDNTIAGHVIGGFAVDNNVRGGIDIKRNQIANVEGGFGVRNIVL
jgi:hypothetical protein